MRFAAIAFTLLVLGVGSGQTPYAGLTRDEAVTLSRDAAASFPQRSEPYVDTLRRAQPVETLESSNSRGDPAWLTIFASSASGSPIRHALWVWATPSGPWSRGVRDRADVARGRPTSLHERCVSVATAHGYVHPAQTVGSGEPPPRVAHPQPVSPFGTLPRFDYLDEWIEPDPVMGSDEGLLVPASTAPGTWGLAGFLLGPDGSTPFRADDLDRSATPASLLSNDTDPPPARSRPWPTSSAPSPS